jgi:hypothetical protein
MLGVIVLWFAASGWLRRRWRATGLTRLPTPPVFSPLYGVRDPRVESLFRWCAGGWWFRCKTRVAALSLARFDDWRRAWRSWPRRWYLFDKALNGLEELLQRGEFYTLRPRIPLRVGGYAGNDKYDGQRTILGLEPWLTRLGPLTWSAVDHELLHCVQHVFRRAFNVSWSCATLKKAFARLPAILYYELMAHGLGSPVVSLMWICLLFWPVLL